MEQRKKNQLISKEFDFKRRDNMIFFSVFRMHIINYDCYSCVPSPDRDNKRRNRSNFKQFLADCNFENHLQTVCSDFALNNFNIKFAWKHKNNT